MCVLLYIYIYTDTGYILPGSMTQRQHSCGASAALAFSSSSSDSSGSLATGWSHSTRHNFPGQNAPILGQLSVIRAFDQLGENCKMSYSICHVRRPYQSATRRLSMMSSQISKKKCLCLLSGGPFFFIPMKCCYICHEVGIKWYKEQKLFMEEWQPTGELT